MLVQQSAAPQRWHHSLQTFLSPTNRLFTHSLLLVQDAGHCLRNMLPRHRNRYVWRPLAWLRVEMAMKYFVRSKEVKTELRICFSVPLSRVWWFGERNVLGSTTVLPNEENKITVFERIKIIIEDDKTNIKRELCMRLFGLKSITKQVSKLIT